MALLLLAPLHRPGQTSFMVSPVRESGQPRSPCLHMPCVTQSSDLGVGLSLHTRNAEHRIILIQDNSYILNFSNTMAIKLLPVGRGTPCLPPSVTSAPGRSPYWQATAGSPEQEGSVCGQVRVHLNRRGQLVVRLGFT